MNTPNSSAATSRITVSIDPDLEDIIPGFLDNRRKDVATLQSALQSNDLKTVQMLGHRMKGDGGGYGFDEISEIGDRLEQAAIRADRTVMKQQIETLVDFLARVDVVYRR
jgi:HPt (histidine-containing phosphotransfer) domain-containing protein